MCQNLLWSFQAYQGTSWKSNWKSPVKKNDRHTTIAFSIGVITCCFPLLTCQAKKRIEKKSTPSLLGHYNSIIFYSGQVSGLFCAPSQRVPGTVVILFNVYRTLSNTLEVFSAYLACDEMIIGGLFIQCSLSCPLQKRPEMRYLSCPVQTFQVQKCANTLSPWVL